MLACGFGCSRTAKRIAYPVTGLPLDIVDIPFKAVDNVPLVGTLTTGLYNATVTIVVSTLTAPLWVGPGTREPYYDAMLQGPDSVYRFEGYTVREYYDFLASVEGRRKRKEIRDWARSKRNSDGRYVSGWWNRVGDNRTSWNFFPYFQAMWVEKEKNSFMDREPLPDIGM